MKSHERLLHVSISVGAMSAVIAGLIFFGVLDIGGLTASVRHGVSRGASNLPQRTETMEWRGTAAAGQTIEVLGINGTIVTQASEGTVVAITAVKRGRRSDPQEVDIDVVQHDGGITICALYPTGRTAVCEPGAEVRPGGGNNDVSVKFTVSVPAGVHFIGRQMNGSIEATELEGDVIAKTMNGSIEIVTTGWATAETINGSIEAAMGATGWERALDFRTVNGSIEVWLPEGVNTDLTASSVRGSIQSEFDLTQSIRSRSRFSGMIGSGGGDLSLKTVTGSIRVLRGH